MGFLDFVKDTINEKADEMQVRRERIEREMERNSNLDDDQLKRKFRNSSGEVKAACGRLLRERGYGSGD